MKDIILGSFEEVSFPDLEIGAAIAKVDTGAYSGAIYCRDIEVERLNGRRVLKFIILGDSHIVYQQKFKRALVRSATGHEVKRYIISTRIRLKGKDYPINIGLADRNNLKYPVLLGRRFLREHSMLVDPRINQEYDYGEDNVR